MRVAIGPYTDNEKKRKVDIRIDDYDVWNLDHTLALIILPCLKQLKETTHGAPLVDNEDVPEDIRSPDGFNWTEKTDDHYFDRWDWVLDEMMYAFERVVKDDHYLIKDYEEIDRIESRISNGLRLFGKYYRGLWD